MEPEARSRELKLRAIAAIQVSKQLKETRMDQITRRIETRMNYLRRIGEQP